MPRSSHTPVLVLLLAWCAIFAVRGAPAVPKIPIHTVDQSLHHDLIRRAVESNKIIKITAGKFQIDFHCESPKPDFCAKAAESAKLACNRIQQSIKLREPINMLFTLFKPCNQDNPTPETCPLAGVVGLAGPVHSFPVRHKDDNQVYMYPTVLLKQTDLVPQGLRVAWPRYDVLSAFNELQRYTFEDPAGQPDLTKNDMEYVATHEISHGLALGIVSSASTVPAGNKSLLAPAHESYPAGSPPGEISLPFDFASQPGDLRMYRLSRPSIYDRFVTYTPPNGSRTRLLRLRKTCKRLWSASFSRARSSPSSKRQFGTRPKLLI
ncbi:hypothetical protein BCR44DRAFT_1049871 [Catenaria anguillulae PL171]|uniref:Peptidase M43 pregnancy-associated plasma-A domain-containing protein n=1 Tax=Catenaria anguillulae PL171 TaxID=765915 RepID=A0A1Y2HR07_9FUNG|nr:hypothetical protein BCR44DRAFT_1049871 [Catenaria anguillulae PL171]